MIRKLGILGGDNAQGLVDAAEIDLLPDVSLLPFLHARITSLTLL